MTTQELKQYIDKVLGNNLRCLLPSYWWKRLFSLTLDKVDEKLDAANIKTINGESVIGEGNLKVGITSVSSMEELNILEVEAGDVATVVSREYGKINPYACYHLTSAPTNKNVIIENWDKFKRITYIDAVQPEESIGKASTILLHAYAPWAQDACQITYWFSELKIYVGSGSSSVQYSLEELNNLLKESDYRLVSITEDAESREVFDKYVSLYSPDNVVSDLYIKGDTWTRLLKEEDATELEVRELYIIGDDAVTGNVSEEYTAEQLAYNKETIELYKQGKVSLVMNATLIYQNLDISCTPLNYINIDNSTVICYEVNAVIVRAMILVAVDNTGKAQLFSDDINSSSITIDSELSAESENPVQNKVITAALNSKVDKVDGKQLSTEDFTSALKAKLEGLSNYDDTSIQNAVNSLTTQINTLVSGDASAAIESFNEIIAFLNGVEDSESLDSIIASIEQQIAAKQDKLVSGTNIKTINGVSLLGGGNIVVDVDTSNLATKEELNAYATSESLQSLGLRIQNDMDTDKRELTEAINTKQDKIDDLEAIRSGAALGATALQEHQDISHLATKEEVIANEEVTAAALNDLNDKLGKLAENVQGETVTKEEFETAVSDLNESLSGKADAQTTSEALTNLLGQVETLRGQVETAVTSEQLSSAVDNVNNTILENEEITAAALVDLNTKITDILERLNNAGL